MEDDRKYFIFFLIFFVVKILKEFINPETAAKISFLSKKEFHKMFEMIDPNQIECKFGGNLPNLTEFWFLFI